MKAFWTLLRREIRAHQLAFGVYFALTLITEILTVLTAPRNPERVGVALLPLLGLVVFSPLMLAHAFSSERRNHQVYLLFALPVPRGWIGLVRVLGNLVHTAGILAVGLVGLVLTYRRGLAQEVTVGASALGVLLTVLVAALFLLYGLVLGVETLRSLPLRARSLWGGLSAVLFVYLVNRALAWGLQRWIPGGTVTLTLVESSGRVFQHPIHLQAPLLMLLMGILWGALALGVFHHFAEV